MRRLKNATAATKRRQAARVVKKPGRPGAPSTRTVRSGSVAGLTVAAFPDLVAQWDKTNGTLKPSEVPAGTGREVWWRCPNGPDHLWKCQVRSRTIRGSNCPFETGKRLAPSQTLVATHPDIAALWHERNTLKPNQVSHGSHENIWWHCPTYKTHVFLMRVDARCVATYPCSICAEAAGHGRRHGATRDASAA
jgi:hypothetical protein